MSENSFFNWVTITICLMFILSAFSLGHTMGSHSGYSEGQVSVYVKIFGDYDRALNQTTKLPD